LSCHGIFEAANPLASRLRLADGDLTLRELLTGEITGLDGLPLAVLSACQTAIQHFNSLPDEAVGFPAALLKVGVAGVVATLWPVDDRSTALLMVKF
jgi:CHAT domain-containing protein